MCLSPLTNLHQASMLVKHIKKKCLVCFIEILIEMLVCFICMETQDRTLIDINHHYQITMNRHNN